jgi:hypothetical protein
VALKVLTFLKAILPNKKIGAWILGLLGALLAGFLGVANSDIKKEFCAAEVVELPKVEAPAAPVAPVEKVEVKK